MQINSLINNIKTTKVSLGSFYITLIFIIIIRNFFENILESIHLIAPVKDFYFDSVEYIHIGLSWICVFFSVVYILNLFDKSDIIQSAKVVLASFGIITIVPLLDYFVFGSGRILYETDFSNFWFKYIYLFDVTKTIPNITDGVRIEIFVVCVMSFVYIYLSTKKIYKALLATWAVYSMIYFYGYLPAVVNILSGSTYSEIVQNSILSIKSVINLNLYSYLPILSILGCLYFFRLNKKYRYMITDSFRIDRLMIYIGILLFAFFVSAKYALQEIEVFNLYDILRVYSAILSLVFSFVYASILNNIADLSIDKISNTNRALVRFNISKEIYNDFKNIALFISFAFAVGVNDSYFFIIIAIVALSYIYSMQPLRLRRFAILSNMVLSVIAILVFLLGVSIVEGNGAFIQSHNEYLIAIFIFYFTASHFKDFKDAKADKYYNVTTLSTLFERNKLQIVLKMITLMSLVGVMILFHFSFWYMLGFIVIYIAGAYIIKDSEYFIIFLQVVAAVVCLVEYFRV